MNTTIATTIDQILRRLPRQGVQREIALQRLTEMYASGEAISALRSAAARAAADADAQDAESDVVADVLRAASELWDGNGVPVHVDGDDGGLRERLCHGVTAPAFRAVVRAWILELRRIANIHPSTGACTMATALQLWNWTLTYVRQTRGTTNDATIVELAEAFCWLAAARCQIVQTVSAASAGPTSQQQFLMDLCRLQTTRSAGAVATTCAELVFGYRKHPAWDTEGCALCYNATELDELEGMIPGIASSARGHSDIIEADGTHPAKAGPCATPDGVEQFVRLRAKLDSCLTGARLTQKRAIDALPFMLAAVATTATH